MIIRDECIHKSEDTYRPKKKQRRRSSRTRFVNHGKGRGMGEGPSGVVRGCLQKPSDTAEVHHHHLHHHVHHHYHHQYYHRRHHHYRKQQQYRQLLEMLLVGTMIPRKENYVFFSSASSYFFFCIFFIVWLLNQVNLALVYSYIRKEKKIIYALKLTKVKEKTQNKKLQTK